MSTAIDQQVATFQEQFYRVKDEVSKVIVGSAGSDTSGIVEWNMETAICWARRIK